jgi:hypothetical protein
MLAQEFATLMEMNDKLAQLIESADEDSDEDIHAVCMAAVEFQGQAANLIGGLAIVTAHVDNSSAAVYLGQLAGHMVECEIECDPSSLLRGLLGGN